MATEAIDLGPFAPEQGSPSRWAVAGGLLGLAAFAIGVGAALLDAANISSLRTQSLVLPLTGAAVVSSIVGLLQVGMAGRHGKLFAAWGLALGVVGGLTAFVHYGVQNGTVRLNDFGTAYFDRDVMSAIWRDLLKAARNTVKLAVLSEAFGIAAGLVVATFTISSRRWLRVPAIVYVDVIRGMPLVMLLILVYFGLTYVGIRLETTIALIVAFTINSSAYIAEIFRAGIQSVERGQMDAARSLGMPYVTGMIHVVIPQAVRRVIPPLTNEFVALVKDTALAIVIGTTIADRELMTAARQASSVTFSATPYMTAALFYLAITLPLIRVVNVLERRIAAPGALPVRMRLLRRGSGVAGQ